MLSQAEIRDILLCRRKYKKFMLVLNVGGIVDLSPVMEVENILLLSQLGIVTGDAFADVLTGQAYPSGRLTATWSAWQDYCTWGDFGERYDNRYREGIYVGYRYFDIVGKKPLFPFGFGLGYTERCEPMALMTSYNLLNGIHTSERPDLLKTLVRSEWGFRGLIMSDWIESGKSARGNKYVTGWGADSVKEGNDIIMEGCDKDYQDIISALKGRNERVQLSCEEAEYCAAHVVDTAWKLAGSK